MDTAWTKLIAADALAAGVRRTGAEIARDYHGQELVLVGLLQGALYFLADLARAIPAPRPNGTRGAAALGPVPATLRVETMRPRSYAGVGSSGSVELLQDLQGDIAGRHVLVVDDIYDSGRTLRFVLDRLAARRPQSLAVACLLVKDAPRAAAVEVRYGLFPIPNVFVVGAGLDLAGLGRTLPDVWALAPGVSEQAALDQLLAQLGG